MKYFVKEKGNNSFILLTDMVAPSVPGDIDRWRETLHLFNRAIYLLILKREGLVGPILKRVRVIGDRKMNYSRPNFVFEFSFSGDIDRIEETQDLVANFIAQMFCSDYNPKKVNTRKELIE